jgi:hypothetical protein
MSPELHAIILAANFASERTRWGRVAPPAIKLTLWTIAAVEGRVIRRIDLADLAGISPLTLDRAVKALVRQGVIEIDQHGTSRAYWIVRAKLSCLVDTTGMVIRESAA